VHGARLPKLHAFHSPDTTDPFFGTWRFLFRVFCFRRPCTKILSSVTQWTLSTAHQMALPRAHGHPHARSRSHPNCPTPTHDHAHPCYRESRTLNWSPPQTWFRPSIRAARAAWLLRGVSSTHVRRHAARTSGTLLPPSIIPAMPSARAQGPHPLSRHLKQSKFEAALCLERGGEVTFSKDGSSSPRTSFGRSQPRDLPGGFGRAESEDFLRDEKSQRKSKWRRGTRRTCGEGVLLLHMHHDDQRRCIHWGIYRIPRPERRSRCTQVTYLWTAPPAQPPKDRA